MVFEALVITSIVCPRKFVCVVVVVVVVVVVLRLISAVYVRTGIRPNFHQFSFIKSM